MFATNSVRWELIAIKMKYGITLNNKKITNTKETLHSLLQQNGM